MAMANRDTNTDISALATEAIRQGREIAERIPCMRGIRLGELSKTALSAMQRRFGDGDVTDGRDLTALEALRAALEDVLVEETLETRIEVQRTYCEIDGPSFDIVTVTDYTLRGEIVKDALDRIDRFLDARQRLLDRANAERLASRLLR